jgi:hypothetical protein
MRPTSHSWRPGPNKIFRPLFPNLGVPLASASAGGARVKQLVLNHSATVPGPAPLQVRSGRGEVDPVFE